ncbi:MAG: flagellar hook-associated protein FlgL [Pseudomonadales bacterium]|nr:flagellar hook-associated protein FlgL [Pseudomonadales bacterium]NRA17344.1 flagellar hook-associated protein FlgL [Oceanospirillaceae bacterium]
MIRVTTAQQYNNSIENMQRSNVSIDKLSQQIASGKRVLKPSDDPVAAAQIIKLQRELAQYDKYEINIKVTDRRLTLQESVMSSMRDAMNRIKELIIQGSTGTLTDSDRASIANNMRTETEFMAGLMNTQDSQGEYIFAGSKGEIKPYQLQQDGSYDYQGDEGQRKIQVSNDLFIPSNDSGEYLFEAVTDDLQTEINGAYASQAGPPTPVVSNVIFKTQEDQDLFKSLTDGLGDLQVVVAAGPVITMTDSSGNPVKDENGVDITARAVPASGTIDIIGMTFDVVAPTGAFPGDDTVVLHTQPEQKNILDIVQDYATELEKPQVDQQARDDFQTATTKAFAQWDQASERNIESVTRLGSRLSFMEKVANNNLDFKLFAETALSSIEDVDMASAISKFKLEEVTLQAAQAVFGRVSALSLFDHIQ